MEQQVLCVCLSDWCKTSNARTFAKCCNQCDLPFNGAEYFLGLTVMVSCKCVLTRIHTWYVAYHKDCKFVKPNGEDVETFPFSVDNMTPKDREEIRTNYFKRHPQVISKCAFCGTDATTKTKKCKGCQHVYYCNLECQKEDWAKHKTFCKSRAGVTAFKLCSCFNETEQMYFDRSKANLCCLDVCTNAVGENTPQHFAVMMSTCSKKGSNDMHMFPKIFCSDKCREDDSKKYIKKK